MDGSKHKKETKSKSVKKELREREKGCSRGKKKPKRTMLAGPDRKDVQELA